MDTPSETFLLRVFVGEDKQHMGRPLYEAIVLKAREQHLAGATVLRGTLGFGHSARLHTVSVLLSEDLPIVIEIVDAKPKIDAFVELLRGIPTIGLITRESVTVVHQRTSA